MPERSAFVNVDALLPQITVEQVAGFYGVRLDQLHRVGEETRTRCFLACGRIEETGDRALAIQTNHPAKQWACHHYGCGKSGNLVSLCDFLKPGESAGGRPRGQRFKDIARDLQEMATGDTGALAAAVPSSSATKARTVPSPGNVPLVASGNERARSLVMLDAKFVLDPAAMPPRASSYFRHRPFLSPEVCRKWRLGYLPRDAGTDRSGGTMRGTIVYPLLSERGEVLTWFGRDPEFDEKHLRWTVAGKIDREPEKFHFVKGFHRGLELFGQHARRLDEPGYREQLRKNGILVVEGPNDVVALDCLGIPAVGLCSNTITDAQVEKVARWARKLAGGVVTLMLDCDVEGENGARQALYELAQHCRVRITWSASMHGGRFRGQQPESITTDDWKVIDADLSR